MSDQTKKALAEAANATNPQQRAWLEFHAGWMASINAEPTGLLEGETYTDPSPYHEGRNLGGRHHREMLLAWQELKPKFL